MGGMKKLQNPISLRTFRKLVKKMSQIPRNIVEMLYNIFPDKEGTEGLLKDFLF